MIIAEIGINHNGDIELAKKLIDGSIYAGADAVKFQKRDIDIVYTKEFLDSHRDSPYGVTQRDQKEGIEFCEKEYDIIADHCKGKIDWFASAWDLESLEFLKKYNCKYNKIASAMLTHGDFVMNVAQEGKYTFISTGMSTLQEIEDVVDIFNSYDCPFELLHCNSTYPMDVEDANLNMIKKLRDKFECKVGYSGHESGIIVSCAAVALGATSIERHITLDRAMYGSDQAASLEIHGLQRLIKYIKAIGNALGTDEKIITENEIKIRSKLRYWE